jgi:c-di-GMP-binding flagellar brake protein YcgR
MADVQNERRKYKRLNAPMYCRPLGRAIAGAQETARLDVQDISLGGVRVYTDDRHSPGDRLELELWLPDGESVTLDTTVRWVDALENQSPARFEVGLEFVDVAKADLERLEAVLKDV